jgi:hypothetical protein
VKETWLIINGKLWRTADDVTVLSRVHRKDECIGEHCVMHNPSEHGMSDWPMHYREDRAIFERTCPHGIGHPDPDQREAWKELLPPLDAAAQQIHACDGCCRER